MRSASLLAAVTLLAAGGGDPELTHTPPADAGADVVTDAGGDDAGDGGDAGPVVCGTGNRPLPEGLTELRWDDDVAVSNLHEEAWQIDVDGNVHVLAEEIVHEAVRFDLERPARVHGFSVKWEGVPAAIDPKAEIAAGLYPDFGYNGFDFWEPAPLWSGTRCAEDVAEGEWVTYVFDSPIEIAHPGLVYVAHRVDTPESPVWPFDGTVQGTGDPCATWDDCHSAMNLPEAEKASYYNGVSFPFQYDYLVKLHVEYTDDLPAEQRIFQPAATGPVASHASFGDYDNDGFDDLVTDGPTLHHNAGDGTFTDATAASGIAAMGLAATGGVWGDYDNDGCLDLFLYAESYTAPDALLRSACDGTFTDVTAASGIVDQQSYNTCGDPANVRSPTAAAAWLDVDADGFLDLYEANFICWGAYTYYTDTVWHNLGDGTFEEWTAQHGFSPKKTASRGAAPIDADGDGDVDLFVNNYVLQANLYFDNAGDGTMLESAIAKGVAGHKDGAYYGHTIGAAWGDLDNDGDFDLVSANLAHPRFFDFSDKTEILLQTGGTFADIAGDWSYPASAAGLRYQETHSVPALADFDHDGSLDLVITAVYDGRPTDFYWGNGDGTFRLDAYHAGITTENGWGVAVADVDHDGDPDLFAHELFRNDLDAAKKGHFLEVRVVGNVAANRAALGSTVRVTAAGATRMRHVQGGTGKGGQDSMYLHFGLGAATSADAISVTFPGGKVVDFAGPFAADQRVWVYEDGSASLGWTP